MEYLLKASAVIAIFYVLYKLFLQRETFFQTNRGYLLIGLLVSALIPLIVIPIYIEYVPTVRENPATIILSPELHENSSEIAFDWLALASMVYLMGVIFFLGKLVIELASLKVLFNKHKYYKNEQYIFIETAHNIPPFSFFNWIVFNPDKYSTEELQHILNHEKAHASELHSVDIILTQLACVVFWFNPFIWLYKKEIEQNLEFIADKTAQEFSSCEKSYQMILLKASVPQHKFLITNNFYNSQIKKRIIMLHKSKSKKVNIWKYSLVLPILALFLMSFNTKEIFIEKEQPQGMAITPQEEASNQLNNFYNNIEPEATPVPAAATNTLKAETSAEVNTSTIAKTKSNIETESMNLDGGISVTIIDKNTTDSELDKIKEDLKKEGLMVKFKGVKRNSSGEITAIKISAKSKNADSNFNVNSDDAIGPIKIVYDMENESISIGGGNAKQGENTFVYRTTGEDGTYKIRKSGKGNNVFVISETDDDVDEDIDVEHEHDSRIVIRQKGKNGKVKTIKKAKNVEVISGDDKVVEIIVEEDGDEDEEIIIVNGKRVETNNAKTEFIVKENGKGVWVTDKNDDKKVITIKNSDNENNVFISGLDGKDPLFIVDGKEVKKDDFKGLKPEKIESVTVLKDESAIKMYGEKGKNGVIIIKTKKN